MIAKLLPKKIAAEEGRRQNSLSEGLSKFWNEIEEDITDTTEGMIEAALGPTQNSTGPGFVSLFGLQCLEAARASLAMCSLAMSASQCMLESINESPDSFEGVYAKMSPGKTTLLSTVKKVYSTFARLDEGIPALSMRGRVTALLLAEQAEGLKLFYFTRDTREEKLVVLPSQPVADAGWLVRVVSNDEIPSMIKIPFTMQTNNDHALEMRSYRLLPNPEFFELEETPGGAGPATTRRELMKLVAQNPDSPPRFWELTRHAFPEEQAAKDARMARLHTTRAAKEAKKIQITAGPAVEGEERSWLSGECFFLFIINIYNK